MGSNDSKQERTFRYAWLADLQSKIQGEVITPDDRWYDKARRGWNLAVDQHPSVVIMAENASDISEAVQAAGEQGLGIAVQSTLHGNVRPADDCMLINTARMNDVRIDADSKTAWISAGAKWGMVLEKSQEVGLAPLLGSSPDVGAVGYILGGGVGWLARKYGLGADSARVFEVITADGRTLRASHKENSDLFWGLRGGGGSLGIVTGVEVQLFPVTDVYGGNLVYPMDQAREVLTRYSNWITTVPDEMTSSVALMNVPMMPGIPEFLQGKSVAMMRGCYCGPVDQGEALVQEWRDWQAPFVDVFQSMPFSQVATISNDPEHPVPAYTTGAWLRDLSAEAIDTLVRYAAPADGPSPILLAEVRHVGGAISEVDPTSAAYSHRDATLLLVCVGMTPTRDAKHHLVEYTSRLKQELQPYLTGKVYMSFLEGEESQERVTDGFSQDAYRRLTGLKAEYDPYNRLGYGLNIPPA